VHVHDLRAGLAGHGDWLETYAARLVEVP